MFTDNMAQKRRQLQFEREDQAQFDAMNPADAAAKINADPINERMAVSATGQMRTNAMQVAFMLAAILTESDFSEENMLPSEVLDGLMLEAFMTDEDDELEDVDEKVKATFAAHVSDALSTLGVEDDIITDMFGSEVDIADAAIMSAVETVYENMPDDGDDFEEFMAAFAFSDESDSDDDTTFDSMNDQVQFDAAGKPKKLRAGKKTVKKVNGKTLVYKAVKAIRNGKRVVINKRISGKLRLSSGQKAGLRKARKKASTAGAIRRQMRSFKKGTKMGLY